MRMMNTRKYPIMYAILTCCIVGLMAGNGFAKPAPTVIQSVNGKARLVVSNLSLDSSLTAAISDPTFMQAWEGAPLAALINVTCWSSPQVAVHPFDTAIAPFNMTSSIVFQIYDERYVNEQLSPQYGFYYGYNDDIYGKGMIREFHSENATIEVDRTPGNAHVTLTAVMSFKGLPKVIGVGPIVPITNPYGSRPAFGTIGAPGRCLCRTPLGAEGFGFLYTINTPISSRDVLDAIYVYAVGSGPAVQRIDAISQARKPISASSNKALFSLRYEYNSPLPSPLPPALWTQYSYDYGLGWLRNYSINGSSSGNTVTSPAILFNPPQPTDYMWFARY